MDINAIMKQAQKMRNKMAAIQEGLAHQTVEATVGGGMVKAIANGSQDLVSLSIAPEVVDPDDIEMLEDLVVSAVNEALKKASDMKANEISKLTGGIKIPPEFM